MVRTVLTRTWLTPERHPLLALNHWMGLVQELKCAGRWLPLLIFPLMVWSFVPSRPAWAWMWLMALAIFAGCKWLTWWAAPAHGAPIARHIGYFIAWPGLDSQAFLAPTRLAAKLRPSAREWTVAWCMTVIGALAVFTAAQSAPMNLLSGCIGIGGIVCILHFGIFHILSCFWRSIGVNAQPVMNRPLAAASLSEFWAHRWNTACSDFVHRYIFRPSSRWVGATAALVGALTLSGIVHELVIAVPARGSYGGPTGFFLIQAAAILFERSRIGRASGLGRGIGGRAFTMCALLLPLPLLCPPVFIQRVIIPFVAIGAIDPAAYLKAVALFRQALPDLIFVAGIGQLGLLIPASLLPFQLKWKTEFRHLPRLLRQMAWVYPGYIVLSFVGFALISLTQSHELASGSGLARAVCLFIAIFWAIRLSLQRVLDVRPFMTAWWLEWGYRALTVVFGYLTVVYAAAAVL